jgi:hypothetical protein
VSLVTESPEKLIMLGLMLFGVQVVSIEIATDLTKAEQELVPVSVDVPTPLETTETFDPEVEQ